MKWSLFCAPRRLSRESGESLMEGSHFGLPASFLTHSGFVRKRTQCRARCHAAPFSSSDLFAPLPPSQKLGHDSLAPCPPAKSVGNWDRFVRLRDLASVFNYLTALFHKMCVGSSTTVPKPCGGWLQSPRQTIEIALSVRLRKAHSWNLESDFLHGTLPWPQAD